MTGIFFQPTTLPGMLAAELVRVGGLCEYLKCRSVLSLSGEAHHALEVKAQHYELSLARAISAVDTADLAAQIRAFAELRLIEDERT